MRRARIKPTSTTCYHVMTRIIERRRLLAEAEKQKLQGLMRQLAGFCHIRIFTYAILGSHLHILLQVPAAQPVSDPELRRRMGFVYGPARCGQLAEELAALRQAGRHGQAEALKARYTYRMHELSEFFKTFKQVFSQWYNRRRARGGPLWNERFKSLVVEGAGPALLTTAAYIELNAVRAGLAPTPQQYRYCGYGQAVAGHRAAREGIEALLQAVGIYGPWQQLRAIYRRRLAGGGPPAPTRLCRPQVQAVLRQGGTLPLPVRLRCRVRYFSDGLALGRRPFVEALFERYRERFGPRRRTGALPLKHGHWSGLCVLGQLRGRPVWLE